MRSCRSSSGWGSKSATRWIHRGVLKIRALREQLQQKARAGTISWPCCNMRWTRGRAGLPIRIYVVFKELTARLDEMAGDVESFNQSLASKKVELPHAAAVR